MAGAQAEKRQSSPTITHSSANSLVDEKTIEELAVVCKLMPLLAPITISVQAKVAVSPYIHDLSRNVWCTDNARARFHCDRQVP